MTAPADPLRRQLFLVLHDPFSGRPVVRPEVLPRGLLATGVAELLLTGRAARAADVTREGLARELLGGSPVPVPTRDLPAVVHRLVVDGLVADGVVRRQEHRRLLGGVRTSFPAVDLVSAVRPRRHLERVLASGAPPAPREAVLLAFVGALGAENALEVGDDRATLRARIGAVTAGLPAALRELIATVDRADAGSVRR